MACISKDLEGEAELRRLAVGSQTPNDGLIPAEHGVQLLGDVVVSVLDFPLAQPQNNVRVRLPVRVSRVQV